MVIVVVMITFTCPTCNQEHTGKRRRCYQCTSRKQTPESIAKIKATMTGRKYSSKRIANSVAGQNRAIADGTYTRFDIAGHMAGRDHPFAVPLGTERIVKDGRIRIKTADGWRYKSRVIWADNYGPIPHGRIIHHINHNSLDDRLENLEMLTPSEHSRRHRAERPDQWRAIQEMGRQARWGDR